MRAKISTIHRDYVFSKDDISLGINYNRGHPDYPRHKHEFSELVIVKSGTGENIVNGVTYPLAAGDVFVITPYQAHAYRHMHNCYCYNIYFDASQLNLKRWDTGILSGYHALFIFQPTYQSRKFNSRLRLTQKQLIRTLGVVELIDQELQDTEPGYRLMAFARFMELVCLLSRYYSKTTNEDSQKVLRVSQAMDYMEKHFAENLTIEELAARAHMSRRNFHRIFSSAVGEAPSSYLIGLRVMQAEKMLQSTDKNITEIAFDCGFSDSNYFARQFRKIMNESPTAFRKRIA